MIPIARPRAVVAAWAVVVVIGALLSSGLFGELANRGFVVPGSQSEQAAKVMRRHLPGQHGTEMFAVVRRRAVAKEWSAQVVDQLHRALGSVGGGVVSVRRAGSSVRYRAGGTITDETLIASIRVGADPADAQRQVAAYDAALEAIRERQTTAHMFGGVVIADRYAAIARDDLARAERIALPVTLAVLLVAFMSVLAAVLPLILAAVGLVVTFALLWMIGHNSGLNVFAVNTASVLALGLSVDFALFIVTRFREELQGTTSVQQALERTLTTAGRAVVLSTVTISTSLLALFAVGVDLFTSMTLSALFATLTSALAATTLLPAILRLVGTRIDLMQLDRVARSARRGTFWRHLSASVTRRPLWCVLAVSALLLVAALPITSFRLELSTVSALPAQEAVRQQVDRVAAAFYPGVLGPVDIVTRGTLPSSLWSDPSIKQSANEVEGVHGWSAVQALLDVPPDDPAAHQAVRRLRQLLAAARQPTYVGGATAASVDLLDRVHQRTPLVIGVAVGLAAIVLGFGLRSVVIPLKAIAGTLLSVGATIGLVLRLFPGAGEEPSLEFFVPLVLFALVFGMSIDYEVFLLSRVREAVRAGHSTRDAVRIGLMRTGRPITLAGIALATVFVGFATSALPAFQQLGAGVALAILIDVTLVRCVLMPAGIILLGRWNWWFFGDRRPI